MSLRCASRGSRWRRGQYAGPPPALAVRGAAVTLHETRARAAGLHDAALDVGARRRFPHEAMVAQERLRVEREDGLVTLALCRGRGNALDRETLQALARAFAQARGAGAPPVVLGALGAAFCTGLDLHQAARLDRAEMGELMLDFHHALLACFAYPGPVVAEIGGHALAGGALLALACDARLIADAPISFGIHGIRLGVAYPDVAVEVLRAALAPCHVERLLYRGRRLDPVEAAQLELVEEPVPADCLAERARQKARELGAGPGSAYAAAKVRVRGAAIERLETLAAEGSQAPGARAWLDVWFDPATQALLREARAGLRRRPPGLPPGDAAMSADAVGWRQDRRGAKLVPCNPRGPEGPHDPDADPR
jgi:enoyl-CoA hydratase